MDLLKYILFSTLEYLSSFAFILIQFRFSLKENISRIFLISILLSFVSYSFWTVELNAIFPILQFIIIILYIQIAMKVSVLNAIIMLFTGYIVFGLAQTCIATLVMHLSHSEPVTGTNSAYQVQLVSSIVMLIFGYLTNYFKGGFSFITARSRFSKGSFSRTNKRFITFIIIAFVITVISNIMLIQYENPPYLWIAAMLLIVLLILFYLSLRRDETVD